MNNGQLWSWLFQKAHPLGVAQSQTITTFSLMAGTLDATISGTDLGNEYWPKDGQVIRSLLDNEIICIRCFF